MVFQGTRDPGALATRAGTTDSVAKKIIRRPGVREQRLEGVRAREEGKGSKNTVTLNEQVRRVLFRAAPMC